MIYNDSLFLVSHLTESFLLLAADRGGEMGVSTRENADSGSEE